MLGAGPHLHPHRHLLQPDGGCEVRRRLRSAPYVAQEVVDAHRWLAPGEMLDGLGMAETTPGPLIMVVQFERFMGAYQDAGPLDPLLAAKLGAVLTTKVTSSPASSGFCSARRSSNG